MLPIGSKAKSKAREAAYIQAANLALLGIAEPPTRRSTRVEDLSAVGVANQKVLDSLYGAPMKPPSKIQTQSPVSISPNPLSLPPKDTTCKNSTQSNLDPSSDDKPERKQPVTVEHLFKGLSLAQALSNMSPVAALKRTTKGLAPHSKAKLYDTGHFYKNDLSNVSQDVLLCMFSSIVQSLFHGASQKAAGTSLLMSHWVRKAASVPPAKSDNRSVADVRTAIKAFNLEPKTTTYACCPVSTCCATYAPEQDYRWGILKYPLTCTQTRFNQVCGSSLVGKSKVVHGMSVPQPIKPYLYHHFHDHVGGMLSRPGIEEAIRLHTSTSTFKEEISDIISSQALRDFVGSDGKPFLRDEGTDIRLLWALCVDWYNPRKNKAAGKSVSTGVIAMICLSLPPDLRTLEENIYLAGVIPGPHEPSLDAVNHFLAPLIGDLAVAYDPGVYFSRTHDHPSGRKSVSAIIPVICDTMASKKVTGNCGHGAQFFCSRCRLTRTEIDNLDVSSWPPGLSREQHEELADAWKASTSAAKQKSHLKAHGIRWSALLSLSYWQPSQWTITEGMHILLLGLIPRHCRDLLELNVKDLPQVDDEADVPSDEAMGHGRKIIEQGSYQKLRRLKLNVLKALCKEKQVVLGKKKKRQRTKAEYIEGLMCGSVTSALQPDQDIEFASLFDDSIELEKTPVQEAVANTTTHCDSDLDLPPLITKNDLITIQRQINKTVRPSWQAHLPDNFGTPDHGKLKADQWRTALEFDIPVSMIQLLANSKYPVTDSNYIRLRRVVEHTLDLATAISWGLSRRTSKHHAERYAFYMKRYLCGIQELFPEYDLKPNHHYALHIPDILLLFGPLHGTWAFPLERLIGRLQGLNTNAKIGEMEATVMNAFCRRSNLRRLVSSEQCPIVLQEAWADLERHLDLRDLNGMSVRDTSRKGPQLKASELDADILESLKKFLLGTGTPKTDVVLGSKNARKLHRLVYFCDSGVPASSSAVLIPGQIREIFEYHRMCGSRVQTEVFIAIHRFNRSNLSGQEAYFEPFPDFRAAIYDGDPDTEVDIIRPIRIKCHANRRPWDSSSFVMRAIDREY